MNERNKKASIIISVLALLALIAAGLALAYNRHWWPFTQENYIIDGINYGPPTEEEIENSQDAKKKLLENEKSDDKSDDGTRRKVNVGVSHSEVIDGNVEIRAFISGVVEGTGTCTATLSQSGEPSVVRATKAFVDTSTSQCEPILIPVNEFSQSGGWTLVVSYKSPTSSGESEKIPVKIEL